MHTVFNNYFYTIFPILIAINFNLCLIIIFILHFFIGACLGITRQHLHIAIN